jgi:thiol-disulfide isomerase/thioredoxin
MKIIAYIVLATLLITSCNSNTSEETGDGITHFDGNWKLVFITQGYQIPINIKLVQNKLTVINGQEQIEMDIDIKNDSFYVDIPNFNAHFEGYFLTDKKLNGVYIKDGVKDYIIPITATYTQENHFEASDKNFSYLKPKYNVSVDRGNRTTKAIGLFTQAGTHVVSSFATETGDYRFLDGVVDGNKLKLSTFDGSHLFLFTADVKGDSLVNGLFISGKTGNYNWVGVANDTVELRNPEKLTYVIKEIKPEDRLKLISSDGDTVTLADEKFNNKVKIVQIMGTWCPNCLDEARYFNTLYKKYNKDGLEIVAVAFENGTNTQVILDKLNKYKKVNNINYTMLYGGKAGNEFALKVFPYLNKVMSFPTAIYFDKNNKIRKIYTGFYGPGTGKYYEDYTASTEKFIEDLLAE